MNSSKTLNRKRFAGPSSCAFFALLASTSLLSRQADAASVDIFLIAEQNVLTSGVSAPFSIETSTVYQLSNLNGGGFAREATLVDNFSFDVDTSLTISSLLDPASGPAAGSLDDNFKTDQGENGAGPTESGAANDFDYVNSEISTLDNSSIPGTTIDPDEQLDFGRNSQIVFNGVDGGFTDLILSDLGGLNPFILSLCDDAECSSDQRLFAGFNSALQRDLQTDTEFTSIFSFDDVDTGTNGTSTLDQTWLFRFHDPVTGPIKITEQDDRTVYTGARLQVDFIGAGGTDIAPIPGPATLPLLAGSLALAGWSLRRRKRS